MSWTDLEKQFPGIDKSSYLKWKEAPFRVASLGAPTEQRKHFENRRYLGPCEGTGCPHCAAGNEVQVSYDWLVTKYPEEATRVLTLSPTGVKALMRVWRKLGDKFEGTIFECSRTGSGPDIVYHFEPVGREAAQAEGALPF